MGRPSSPKDYTDAKVSEQDNGDGTINVLVEASADKIPDVKPDGGSDSGFDVDVDEWENEVNADIPI